MDAVVRMPLRDGSFTLINRSVLDCEVSCQFRDGHWWRGRIDERPWNILVGKHTRYARSFAKVGGKARELLLHRLILNAPNYLYGDHIDGNGLNNSLSNIRLVTPTENARHKLHFSDNRRPRKYCGEPFGFMPPGRIKYWFASRERRFYSSVFDGAKWKNVGYSSDATVAVRQAIDAAISSGWEWSIKKNRNRPDSEISGV